MKTIHILMLGLSSIHFMATAQSTAQSKQETKVRVKKIEVVNGVEKITDTTYTVQGPININKLDQLPNSGIPPLPNLQEHLVVSEGELKNENESNTKKIIVITNEITGNQFDSIVIDDKLKNEIDRALEAAEKDGGKLKVEKTVCIDTSKDGQKSSNRIEKIIIVKTSKISDVSNDELKILGLHLTEQNKLRTVNSIEVAPNPSSGQFNLKFELTTEGDTQISVLSSDGKIIYDEVLKDFKGSYNKEITLSDKTAGIYFVKVQQNHKTAVKKLVIQ